MNCAMVTSKSTLTVNLGSAAGLGMLTVAPMIAAAGLLSAAPALANPAMCAVAPSVYQTSGACALPGTAQQAPHSAQSGLRQANQTGPATAGTDGSLPPVNAIPCTGMTTDICTTPPTGKTPY